MKRALLGVAVVAMLVGMPLGTGTASAKPGDGVYTATFTCGHNSSSTVTFNLSDTSTGGVALTRDVTLECGSTRSMKTEITTDGYVEAGFVNIVGWNLLPGEGCFTGGSSGFLAYRGSCDASSGGSKLVVR